MTLNRTTDNFRPLPGPPPPRVISLPAFASYIDGYQVPEFEALNEQLLTDIAAWRGEKREGLQSSNYRGWHSSRDLFERPEDSFRNLISHIAGAAFASIRRYWAEFDPSKHGTFWEGWVNANGPGATNGPHAHTHHLSGVYYVKVPVFDDAREGMIAFLNPAGALHRSGTFDHRLIRAELQLRPRPGQLFIFPSYLQHWVTPHFAEEERISIAFNVGVAEMVSHDGPAD